MRKAFADTMLEVGQTDSNLVVLVGDISHFALQPFAKACPGRFYNIGILEPTMVNMAAGLSHTGLHPVVHTIAPFLIERSFEQIKLDFCYQALGGTLVSVGGAFDYSGLGCSHHTYNDLGLIKGLPETTVIYPASPQEFNLLFKQSYRNGKLNYFRLPSEQHGIIFEESQIRIGKTILVKKGRDITILATGPHLKTAMNALPILSDKAIDAEILYYSTYKPFDKASLLHSVRKTKNLLVIEEHSIYGGISEDSIYAIQSIGLTSFDSIHIPNQFQRGYGKYHDHLQSLGFTPENIVSKTLSLLK